jgi:hypothetical protein
MSKTTSVRPNQPPIQKTVKWPRHDAIHSPPYTAKVRNAWNYTFTPPHIFKAWCLTECRDYCQQNYELEAKQEGFNSWNPGWNFALDQQGSGSHPVSYPTVLFLSLSYPIG